MGGGGGGGGIKLLEWSIRVRDRYRIFFARERKWDAQTMHLLSASNVAITKKNVLKVLFRVGGGGINPWTLLSQNYRIGNLGTAMWIARSPK